MNGQRRTHIVYEMNEERGEGKSMIEQWNPIDIQLVRDNQEGGERIESHSLQIADCKLQHTM